VTKPRLEVSDENLVISYDILNTKSSDFFLVWIEVTDAMGNKINAISVAGDVGNDVRGGKNKRITWDFGNDSIFIDGDLFVKVNAEKIAAKESEVKDNNENQGETKTDNVDKNNQITNAGDLTDNKELTENKKISENKTKTEPEEEKRTPIKEEGSTKEISKGKIVLTSAVLPGWGQSKVNNGKPFWLMGAAGYGCIAGSVLMNRSASSAYDDYKSSKDLDESNTLFDKATRRNSLSKVLGYSALGIWAADLIWVMVTPVKKKESANMNTGRKLMINPGFDSGSGTSVVTLTYYF
jgi:hypothetical protein